MLVVGEPGELEFGSRQGDNSAWFPGPSAFKELWSGEQHVLMFLSKNEFDYFRTTVKPPPVIKAESGQRLLISNR